MAGAFLDTPGRRMLPPVPMRKMKFQLAARLRPLRAGAGLLLWTTLAAWLFGGCTPAGPASLLEGRKLLDQGQPRAALLPLHDAVQLLRTNGLAWSYLGLAYQQTGQPSNAVTCYVQALRWDRDLVDVRYNLGQAYLDLGRPEAAKLELTTFTVQRPRSFPGWLARGTAELRLKEVVAGLNSFSTALRLNSTNAAALNGLGMALVQRGRPREAAPYFSAAVQQQPNFAAAWRNLATVQQQHLKDMPAALQTWKQFAALTPPPADLEAVQNLIRQIETPPPPPAVNTNLIAAPTAPATNLVRVPKPAVSNPPAAVPGNSVAIRPAPPSNPPPVIFKPVLPPPRTNPPVVAVVSNPPPPPPPPPLEVVQLTPEPVIPPARDPVPPVKPAVTSAPPVVAVTAPVLAAASTNAEPKRGFFAKVNPLNLFKKKPKEEPRPTRLPEPTPVPTAPPLPPPSALVATNPAAPVITATPPATLPPPRAATPRAVTPRVTPPPPSARYAYTRPLRPAVGNRPDATLAFRAGIEAQAANRPQEAFDAYQRATLADPQFLEAWNNLGLAAHALGKSELALTAFENALAVRPDSAEARYNFGVALRDAGYPLDAVSEFQQVLITSPADVRTHLALGNLCAQRLKQPQQARPHYRRVLDLDPANPQAAAIRAWLRSNPG